LQEYSSTRDSKTRKFAEDSAGKIKSSEKYFLLSGIVEKTSRLYKLMGNTTELNQHKVDVLSYLKESATGLIYMKPVQIKAL
jgi:hypothetical protein